MALFEEFVCAYEGELDAVAGEADDVEGFLLADARGLKLAYCGGGEGFDGVEAHLL